MIEMQHQQNRNRQIKEKRLQPTSISSSIDDVDIRRPSNLAMFVCLGFGK